MPVAKATQSKQKSDVGCEGYKKKKKKKQN
jgi:hypothetical protein